MGNKELQYQYYPITQEVNPAGNYMFKVNNRNSRTRCEICSELTIKTPERRQGRRLVSVLLTLDIFLIWLWTYFSPCSSGFIINFERVNPGWKMVDLSLLNLHYKFYSISYKRRFSKKLLRLFFELFCCYYLCSVYIFMLISFFNLQTRKMHGRTTLLTGNERSQISNHPFMYVKCSYLWTISVKCFLLRGKLCIKTRCFG